METVKHIIEVVSRQLNDQQFNLEYTRWNRTTQIEYLNQALKEIGAYRPDAFTVSKSITLVPGILQSVGNYNTLKDIHVKGVPVHEADAEMIKAFAAYSSCSTEVEFVNGTPVYNLKSFAVSSTNPKEFYVSPPVPIGMAPVVTATLIGAPPVLSLQDWDKALEMDSKYYNNVIDFMMGRAYELDSESAQSRANSNTYFSKFYATMGVKYKIDSAVRAGNYKGEVGTGDPRAVIR